MVEENAGFITDGLGAEDNQQQAPTGEAVESNTPTPEGESQAGDSQSAAPKWKAQLPDDLKDNEDLNQYESIGALAKALLDVKDGSHGDEVAVPGEDDAEAWGQLYDKLGRPSSQDEYALKDSQLPDDVEKSLRAEAYDMGLTQKQFGQLADILGKSVETQKVIDQATFKGTDKDCELQLRKEFGDQFDAKMNHMKRGATELLTDDLRKALGLFGHLNNPDIARAMVRYGEAIAEDVPAGKSARQTDDADGWDYPTE